MADYYGISFLEMLHGVAGSPAEAAAAALRAGVDVELPNVRCYGAPLAEAVRSGLVPEHLVDRAAGRVLTQKFELGLLDPEYNGRSIRPVPAGEFDFDPPAHRDLARQLAEQSIVLLANNGQLPLDPTGNMAVIGPLADDPLAFFGCYTFPRHVGHAHPGTSVGIPLNPVLAALRQELPSARISYARGCDIMAEDRSAIPAALECASAADTIVAVLGDEAGLFGRGSSGEGCDVTDLRLPGGQADLLDELVALGKPVVLVLITGRPYAIEGHTRLAAIVQSFFPGQEGGAAIAGVLSGRVVPSGKLPVELPRLRGAVQSCYLAAPLAGQPNQVSSVDPTPLFPFGHGLSYTTFDYSDLTLLADESPVIPDPDGPAGSPMRIGTDGAVEVGCTIRNTGDLAGAEVVQLYLRDPVAQVTRPVRFLAGFARVMLQPGQASRVTFRVHADRTSFHGTAGTRIVEPGRIEVAVGASSADLRLHGQFELCGPERQVGHDRVLSTPVIVMDL